MNQPPQELQLALADSDLDATADEIQRERVIAAVKAQGGSGATRSTQRRSVSGANVGSGDVMASRSSARRSMGQTRIVRCSRALAFTAQATN